MSINKTIKLSIGMLTYNHGRYIRKALDSILMQKTDFEYEVIIGEDCSEDDTAGVVLEYAQRYPDRIKPIFHEKNIGAKQNSYAVYKKCQGEYFAYLEGDDYWTDENKLQKQMDFLENHKEYAAVYHQCSMVNQEGYTIKEQLDWFCKDEDFLKERLEEFQLPGQSSTAMMRNCFQLIEGMIPMLEAVKTCPLDRVMPVFMLSLGKIYCSRENMSAYRYVVRTGESNYTSRNAYKLTYGFDYFYSMTVTQARIGKKLGVKMDFFQIRMVFIKDAKNAAIQYGKWKCWWMCFTMLLRMPKRRLIAKIWSKYGDLICRT